MEPRAGGSGRGETSPSLAERAGEGACATPRASPVPPARSMVRGRPAGGKFGGGGGVPSRPALTASPPRSSLADLENSPAALCPAGRRPAASGGRRGPGRGAPPGLSRAGWRRGRGRARRARGWRRGRPAGRRCGLRAPGAGWEPPAAPSAFPSSFPSFSFFLLLFFFFFSPLPLVYCNDLLQATKAISPQTRKPKGLLTENKRCLNSRRCRLRKSEVRNKIFDNCGREMWK